MYVDHPEFVPPSNPNIPIWRYTELAKFLDLLEQSALYFTRLDRFSDPFEGSLTKATTDDMKAIVGDDELFPPGALVDSLVKTMTLNSRASIFVNCWHMNEHESEAMWRLYSEQGIAVRSTYRKLRDSFDPNFTCAIYIGQVRYRDYSGNVEVMHSEYEPVLSKRHSFEYERELRAAIEFKPVAEGETIDPSKPDHPFGIHTPVDLRVLIEKIYVSPGRPRWFRDLVVNLLDRYQLADLPVETSDLSARPELI